MSGMWALLNAVTGEDVFLQLGHHFHSFLGFERSTTFEEMTMIHYPPGELVRGSVCLTNGSCGFLVQSHMGLGRGRVAWHLQHLGYSERPPVWGL